VTEKSVFNDFQQNNPYGNDSLFKNPFSDAKKVEELLKPTNPAAQKALSSTQYKVSPLRNIKPKPKPISTRKLIVPLEHLGSFTRTKLKATRNTY